jgi:hypothetical protein
MAHKNMGPGEFDPPDFSRFARTSLTTPKHEKRMPSRALINERRDIDTRDGMEVIKLEILGVYTCRGIPPALRAGTVGSHPASR